MRSLPLVNENKRPIHGIGQGKPDPGLRESASSRFNTTGKKLHDLYSLTSQERASLCQYEDALMDGNSLTDACHQLVMATS